MPIPTPSAPRREHAGNLLCEIRKQRSMTQAQAASFCGVGRRSISMSENTADQRIKDSTLLKILAGYANAKPLSEAHLRRVSRSTELTIEQLVPLFAEDPMILEFKPEPARAAGLADRLQAAADSLIGSGPDEELVAVIEALARREQARSSKPSRSKPLQ